MTGGSTRAAEHVHGSADRAPERRCWLLVAVGVLVVVASYVGLVLTPAGQAVENAALRGADQVGPQVRTESDEALTSITVASLAVACALIAVVGLLRRSIPLATAALGTVVASLLVTEALKRVVLPRPALVEASAAYTENSFPSGHTTIAGYTITSKWHRLSDTLGSAGIVLVVASLAALWLHRRGLVRHVETGGHRARIWFVVVPLALSLLVGVGLAAVLLVATGDLLDRDPVTEDNVFLAFQLLAGVGSVATTLALWWSWHRLEVAPTASPTSAHGTATEGAR